MVVQLTSLANLMIINGSLLIDYQLIINWGGLSEGHKLESVNASELQGAY